MVVVSRQGRTRLVWVLHSFRSSGTALPVTLVSISLNFVILTYSYRCRKVVEMLGMLVSPVVPPRRMEENILK